MAFAALLDPCAANCLSASVVVAWLLAMASGVAPDVVKASVWAASRSSTVSSWTFSALARRLSSYD